jgi:hypothetical protein
MGVADDGALWTWLRDGRVCELHSAAVRQATLDIIELGVDVAATLDEDDGGVWRLLGYRASTPRPPALDELLERLASRTPGSRPDLRVVS